MLMTHEYFSVFVLQCHAYLMTECPELLSNIQHMTPSRQLALVTHKLQACMKCEEACHWSPSIIAVSLLSLELEQFRADWFPLTLSLLKFIQVSVKFHYIVSKMILLTTPNRFFFIILPLFSMV